VGIVLDSSTGAGQADGAQARLPGPPRLADCITTYDQPDTANSSASAASCSTRCATHQLLLLLSRDNKDCSTRVPDLR